MLRRPALVAQGHCFGAPPAAARPQSLARIGPRGAVAAGEEEEKAADTASSSSHPFSP